MNELCAQFEDFAVIVPGANPSSNAVPGFEHEYLPSGINQRACGRQTGHSGPDHQDALAFSFHRELDAPGFVRNCERAERRVS